MSEMVRTGRGNQARGRNNRDTYWEERSQTVIFFCRQHDPLYRRLKKNHQKTPKLITTFSNVAGYKKSIAFQYTNNELPEKEIEKTVTFTITSGKIKYLRVNLRKSKTFTIKIVVLKKEIEKLTENEKIFPVSGKAESILSK